MSPIAGLTVRPARAEDAGAIWGVIGPTIAAGETYTLPRDMDRAAALAYWLGADRRTFVAEAGGQIFGTYFLRANQSGGGDHVCNCGYMTAAEAAGQGVGRAMCAHSLREAKAQGFAAMQFNFVVSTNTRAVALWRSMGFEVVGRLPGAFRHPHQGAVDALVMFQPL